METARVQHPSEDQWEEYAFRRVTGPALDALEDHLLVCGRCQATLTELDDFIQRVKSVPAEDRAKPAERGLSSVRSFRFLPRALVPSLAFAALAGVVVTIVVPRNMTPPAAARVELASYRGGAEAIQAHARAGQPLELSVDLTDLPAVADPYLEVVTATGKTVLAKAPARSGRTLLPKGLPAGMYWIRLYAPETQLVREFGLRVD